MIPTAPPARYPAGTKLRIVQHVRIGDKRWATEVVGAVERETQRPIGGMEMGTKALYCHQPSLLLRLDDGELTSVAVDENTEIYVLG
jgi:hypothetical protein